MPFGVLLVFMFIGCCELLWHYYTTIWEKKNMVGIGVGTSTSGNTNTDTETDITTDKIRHEHRDPYHEMKKVFQRYVGWMLMFLFFILPGTSLTIFQTFSCVNVDPYDEL